MFSSASLDIFKFDFEVGSYNCFSSWLVSVVSRLTAFPKGVMFRYSISYYYYLCKLFFLSPLSSLILATPSMISLLFNFKTLKSCSLESFSFMVYFVKLLSRTSWILVRSLERIFYWLLFLGICVKGSSKSVLISSLPPTFLPDPLTFAKLWIPFSISFFIYDFLKFSYLRLFLFYLKTSTGSSL